MSRIGRFTAEDYTKALALLVDYTGNITKFRPSGLPTFGGIEGRARNHPDTFKAEYDAAIAKRNERLKNAAQRTNYAYSDKQYTDALAAFAGWEGLTNDFKPDGLPQYFALIRKAKRDIAFRERFLTADAKRKEITGQGRKKKETAGRSRKQFSLAHFQMFIAAIRHSNCTSVTQFKRQKRTDIPSWWTAHRFAKSNPQFAANLSEALRAKSWFIYGTPGGVSQKGRKNAAGRQPHTEYEYNKYIEAIEQSPFSRKSDFTKKKFAGLPRWRTVVKRAKKHPEYGCRVSAAMQAKGWKGIREVPRYTEQQYRESIALLAKFDGASAHSFAPRGLPAYLAIIQRAEWDNRTAWRLRAARVVRFNRLRELGLPIEPESGGGKRYYRRITDEEKAEYVSAIEAGTPQSKLLKAKGAVVTFAVRKRLLEADPDFGASIARADRARLERQFAASKLRYEERWKRANALRSKRTRGDYEVGQLRVRLDLNDYYAAARASLKGYRQIPEFDLEDIRTDMVEAMINGSLLPEEAAERAFEYVGAHNRMFSPHQNKSIDQRRFEDGNATVGDYLTADDYSYAE